MVDKNDARASHIIRDVSKKELPDRDSNPGHLGESEIS